MTRSAASFRDPSGFVFTQNDQVYRQVNQSYYSNYDALMQTGLYTQLTRQELLIRHQEVRPPRLLPGSGIQHYRVLQPEKVPFISYPYEWCFSQLKDAALLTLRIQKTSLSFAMSLKDATSFNIQFLRGKPIFIDTLSFERLQDGPPWVAYRQFCEQFLAPLALIAYGDVRLGRLLLGGVGSVPLDLAAKLLPIRAKIKPSLLVHLILQAKGQSSSRKTLSDQPEKTLPLGRSTVLELVDNLIDTVNGLSLSHAGTIWTSYYAKDAKINNYTDRAMSQKKLLVKKYLKGVGPKLIWDLGANDGTFSRLAASGGASVISLDNDPYVVEKNYLKVKEAGEKNILPLWLDIANPTPPLGWQGSERSSLLDRPHPDLILALALVHHLAIANNIPLPQIAQFLSQLGPWLVIEFVPKEDSQVKLLLAHREDIFANYNQANFEKAFSRFFRIEAKSLLSDSRRTVYLMKNEKIH